MNVLSLEVFWKEIKIEFIYGGRQSGRAKPLMTEHKLTYTGNVHIKQKKRPLQGFTYACNIIGCIIKKIKIEFIYGRSSSYRAKTARCGTKIDLGS